MAWALITGNVCEETLDDALTKLGRRSLFTDVGCLTRRTFLHEPKATEYELQPSGSADSTRARCFVTFADTTA
jgi:hypothetical protein